MNIDIEYTEEMLEEMLEQELRDMIKEGKTLYQISRKFNTTVHEIYELCKYYNLVYPYRIPKPSKQDLESMYTDEGMSQRQISREFDVDRGTVSVWLRNCNISTRGNGTLRVPMPPKETLEKMNSYEGMTRYQISAKFAVSKSTLDRWIRNYNISTVRRPEKEVLEKMYYKDGMTQYQISREFGVAESTVQLWLHKYNIQTVVPIPPKDDLISCIDSGLSQLQIAEKYGVHDSTIFRWCEYYEIPGMVNGYRCYTDEHINWRYAVFERDHRTCQMCGATNTRIEAHHIVPYCDHPEVAYELENGITLCEGCHKSIRGIEYDYIDQFAAITQCGATDMDKDIFVL